MNASAGSYVPLALLLFLAIVIALFLIRLGFQILSRIITPFTSGPRTTKFWSVKKKNGTVVSGWQAEASQLAQHRRRRVASVLIVLIIIAAVLFLYYFMVRGIWRELPHRSSSDKAPTTMVCWRRGSGSALHLDVRG